MKSPFDDLPPVTKAKLPFEPYPGATGVIGQVFGNVDTTYKFFWFLAVLEETKNAPPRSDLSLQLNRLTREMVAQAWPCRRLFKLWFGHQDRLQTLIDRLAERSGLSDSARADEVRNASAHLSDDEVVILENYVPYRFLAPWFRSALIGVKDHARHSLIQLLAERSARSSRPAPYHFNTVIGRPLIIHINSKWLTFFQSNHLPLKAFAQLSLARYFETRNPGIPGIINKLERPGARKLDRARQFWDTILDHHELRCIYSGELIQPDYDLDHFLPWSFVTHDLIWNLTPAPRSINLQKSAAVPKLVLYLPGFVDQHYRALPVLKVVLNSADGARRRALEAVTQEYTTLFKMPSNDLLQIGSDRFAELLRTEIHAQADLARRLSFETDWVWRACPARVLTSHFLSIPHNCQRHEDSIESGSGNSRRRWHWRCRHARTPGRTGEGATSICYFGYRVTDPAGYQKYGEPAAVVVATHHGKILARGGKAVVFDGRAPQRVVVIEFPTLADAERWRSSPEFQKGSQIGVTS